MVYNIENGASLQKLPGKSQISGKIQWILLLKIKKKESKTLNTFQKLLERVNKPEPSVRPEQTGGLDQQRKLL